MFIPLDKHAWIYQFSLILGINDDIPPKLLILYYTWYMTKLKTSNSIMWWTILKFIPIWWNTNYPPLRKIIILCVFNVVFVILPSKNNLMDLVCIYFAMKNVKYLSEFEISTIREWSLQSGFIQFNQPIYPRDLSRLPWVHTYYVL